MPIFNNFSGLNSYINTQIMKSGEKMAEEIQNKLQEYVLSNLYNRYSESPNYQRTYNLINSIKVSSNKNGDTFCFQIYFDDSSEYEHYNFYGQSTYIPMYVNDGWTLGRPIVGYMDDTMQFLNETKEYIQTFVEDMRSKGLKII